MNSVRFHGLFQVSVPMNLLSIFQGIWFDKLSRDYIITSQPDINKVMHACYPHMCVHARTHTHTHTNDDMT
jgi:hypothetical protein